MPGHCLIVPSEHVASARQVDDHAWTELRNFKKCLLQMFAAQVLHGSFPLRGTACNLSEAPERMCLAVHTMPSPHRWV